MRPLLSGFLFLIYYAGFSPSVFSQSIPRKLNAEATIQRVTIFSSGARVERTAAVNIQPGRTEISFPGLSNQLDQQTVQLSADATITLLSVQTTKDYLTARRIEQQEQDFIDRINALTDRSAVDKKLLEVCKNEENMLAKNQEIGGQAGVRMIDLKEALEFQRTRLTELYERELDIQKRINLEERDLAANTQQLREFSKKKDSVNYIVTALIESKESRAVNFRLLYNVKDAGWYPTYNVRVSSVSEPLSVLMNANVFQRSGETWKNIPLLLSTGNPGDNATPSRLQPWMLGFYDPSFPLRGHGVEGETSGRVTDDKGAPIPFASVMMKGSKIGTNTDGNGYFKIANVPKGTVLVISGVGFESRQLTGGPGYATIALTPSNNALQEVVVVGYGTSRSASEGEPAAMERKQKMQGNIQTVSTFTQYQPTTTVYKIDDKYTLESDGKTTTIGIKELEVPALFEYYSAPKVDPSAFLTAKVVNWQDLDLQSGEVSLFFEGSYLGKTYLDLSSVADTLSLSLGKDKGIRVSRKLLKEYSSKKFMGSNRTDSREYEIEVVNAKRDSVNITLVDQVPVSITREIGIEDLKTGEAQFDKESGMATWALALPPGQSKKLKIGYSIKYPKDRKVVLE
jgi:hypothetical protein